MRSHESGAPVSVCVSIWLGVDVCVSVCMGVLRERVCVCVCAERERECVCGRGELVRSESGEVAFLPHPEDGQWFRCGQACVFPSVGLNEKWRGEILKRIALNCPSRLAPPLPARHNWLLYAHYSLLRGLVNPRVRLTRMEHLYLSKTYGGLVLCFILKINKNPYVISFPTRLLESAEKGYEKALKKVTNRQHFLIHPTATQAMTVFNIISCHFLLFPFLPK